MMRMTDAYEEKGLSQGCVSAALRHFCSPSQSYHRRSRPQQEWRGIVIEVPSETEVESGAHLSCLKAGTEPAES